MTSLLERAITRATSTMGASANEGDPVAATSKMLELGTQAPDFDLPDVTTGRRVRTSDIADHKALERWAAAEFGLTGEPRLETQPKDKAERKGFLGRERTEAEKWKLSFARPNGRVIVEYVPGSPSVSVRQQANNLLGVVKNLHKGTGLGVFWVLFLDSIAGALVAMSITGFLLWTRLHGTRLLAGGILAASVVVATGAVWPNWL